MVAHSISVINVQANTALVVIAYESGLVRPGWADQP